VGVLRLLSEPAATPDHLRRNLLRHPPLDAAAGVCGLSLPPSPGCKLRAAPGPLLRLRAVLVPHRGAHGLATGGPAGIGLPGLPVLLSSFHRFGLRRRLRHRVLFPIEPGLDDRSALALLEM